MGLEPTTLRSESHALPTELAGHDRCFVAIGVFEIIIDLSSTCHRYDAWKEWIDIFDQTLTRHLETRFLSLAAIDPRDHFLQHELYGNISFQLKKYLPFIRI